MKKGKTIRSSELLKLRRAWQKRIDHLRNGPNWALNNDACKRARADHAEGFEECVIDLNYLLKYGKL